MLAPAQPAAGQDAASWIEEIVVTARKREEPLTELPLAVSVFDGDSIRSLGLVRLEDVARFTPGFAFDTGTGRQASSYRPVIRGLTTVRNGIANTSAATTFIDGVYVGGSVQTTELYNLERIEILRGPQAAQYGRGTYAGAINYVTRQPADAWTGEVAATAAEHAARAGSGWVSGPLSASAGLLLAAGYNEYGGEYDNVRDGSTVGDEEQTDLTAKVLWRPTTALAVTARVGWQATRDGHFAAALQPRTLNNCCFRTPEAPRAREYFIGKAPAPGQVRLFTDLLDAAGGAGTEVDRWQASLGASWSLPGGSTITSLTGYVADEVERGFDLSYAAYDPLPFLGPGLFTKRDAFEQTDLSQELRLSSPNDRTWRWTVGAYAYAGELDRTADQRVFLDADGQVATGSSPGSLTNDEVRNLAAFGGLDVDLGEYWTVGAEIRWARDEITVTNRANDGSATLQARFEDHWNSVTPRLTATFAATPTLNVYGNIARGTKPGDFNPNVPDETLRAVDEESVWSYELGLKGNQGAFRYVIAAYYLDVDDQQLTTLAELADGRTASLLTNAGSTRVYGFEAEWGVALTEHLHADLSYAWTDAEFRDYVSPEQADLLGSDGSLADTQRLGSVAGNMLPRVPEHMASAIVGYRRPLRRFGSAYVTADWSLESSRYAQEHNFIETGNRQLLGLRAGLARGAWDFSLWVTNLLDDDAAVDIQRYFDTQSGSLPSFPQAGPRASSSPRGFTITLPRGRQFGGTVRYGF